MQMSFLVFFIFFCIAYCKYKKWVYICTMQNKQNNTTALVSQINMVISQHGINFIDSRIEREWNEKAIALLNKIECNVKPTKTADNYIKKVKYDNFLILQFYLKKFSK